MLSVKNFAISLLVTLMLGLSSWFIFTSERPPTTSTDVTHRPDAFMENIVATIINKEGNLSLRVEAPKMVHYIENDTTHIETPHITMYRQSPQPWHINSRYAKATQGLDQIYFWDNVVIHHMSDIASPTTTMTMMTLTVYPAKQTAQTSDNVTLIQPDTTIHGLGMLANLNNGTVQLLSQARGEYVPSAS